MGNRQDCLETCYGPVSSSVMARAVNIRLLLCDVDGVLSDGMIYMGNHGEELKTFHVHDGYGIRSLFNAGLEVGLITGRRSAIVEARASTLGIKHVYQGQHDKLLAFRELLATLSLQPHQTAYIGDDLIDWPVMALCGLAVSVANGHPLLRAKAHYVTRIQGGHGAVREVCDLLLQAQGKLEQAQGLSL
ncbi:MAG: 3-deoxy-manno-octulosonate-8-phosphatase KdsC [Enterobacteriaceae bacterium]